ncbi:MAG: sensor histidine kinase [Thermodesulfobacteria bacterium]|nr:sensor histidine kinase [Thermodesulfobacteriota bacterium]
MKAFFSRLWARGRKTLSPIDLLFFALRLVAVVGGTMWLLLAPVSPGEREALIKALVAFSLYSLLLFVAVWRFPQQVRRIYVVSLVLDLAFVFSLVNFISRYDNSFFLGYYLLTALHAFYFGLRFGLLVATVSAFLYFLNVRPHLATIHWTDFALRVSFLYLIAVPLGLLSEKLRRDKEQIEELNRRLADSLANLKRMQDKLIQAEKFSALGRLTMDIAHEIRNPLTALGGMARRLEKVVPEGSKEREYVRIILHEASRLESILRDLLALSSGMAHELKRGDLNQVVREAVEFCRRFALPEGVELLEEYDPHVPRVYLNPPSVKQAVENLLTNALDAVAEKGRGGWVRVRTGRAFHNEITWATVSVEDNGPGIPPEKIDLIFEPFYSTKKVGVGTGLGLTIVRKIMEEHRGFVRVESEVGRGSTFTLYFPYQSEEEDQKTPCWEYLKCGIEKDPSRRCPAYPYFGRICWAIAGTMCEGRPMGIYAQKIAECRRCPFYQSCHGKSETSGNSP